MMNPNYNSTYLFYDLETTGLNKSFNQVLQFAAIRTDLEFNEIERHQIFVKLNPDLIPEPEAMMVHRIDIETALQGEKEIDAMRTIHELLNAPGTISLGYNTIDFDDEFLRFSFFRNLLPPYTHQYANGCSRMDLYPITMMYYLFKPDSLRWPLIEGKSSLRLEHLNKENQFASGQAHNAMVDVEATLGLAKTLKNDFEMWEYVLGYFDKKIDLERINKFSSAIESDNKIYKEALILSGRLGFENNLIAPAISLGQHFHYKNQMLWLRIDNESLSDQLSGNIADTFVFRKKLGEPIILLPTYDRFLHKLSDDRLNVFNENKKWLQNNVSLLKEISHYHQNYLYPKMPDCDPEGALYETAFSTPHEEFLFSQFHLAKPNEKSIFIDKFPNPIHRELAKRILIRHFRDDLTDIQKENYPMNLNNKIIDYKGDSRLTPETALIKIEALRKKETLDQQQLQILKGLENYIKFEWLRFSR